MTTLQEESTWLIKPFFNLPFTRIHEKKYGISNNNKSNSIAQKIQAKNFKIILKAFRHIFPKKSTRPITNNHFQLKINTTHTTRSIFIIEDNVITL